MKKLTIFLTVYRTRIKQMVRMGTDLIRDNLLNQCRQRSNLAMGIVTYTAHACLQEDFVYFISTSVMAGPYPM